MRQKIILFGLVSMVAFSGMAQGVFKKGDRKVDFTAGIGTVDYPDKTRVTFDQHLGMEWGIAKIATKMTVGVGFNINNTYGGALDGMVSGSFNYSYNKLSYGKTYSYQENKWKSFSDSKKVNREGVGTADADVAREDVNAQAVAAIHFSPISRLDTYLKIGVGVGCMNWVVSNIHNEEGFDKADVNRTSSSKVHEVTDSWKYDDLAHVKWEGYKSKVVPSMSAYLGATYMLNEKWGLDGQIGLISTNIKGKKKVIPTPTVSWHSEPLTVSKIFPFSTQSLPGTSCSRLLYPVIIISGIHAESESEFL